MVDDTPRYYPHPLRCVNLPYNRDPGEPVYIHAVLIRFMKKALFRAGMLIVSVGIAFSVIEGVLAISPIAPVSSVLGVNKKIFSCYRPDRTTVYQTIPGNTRCPSEEINNEGFRIHPGAQPTKESVVILGDSFVFGNYVDASHTVSSYVQKALNDEGNKYNVINAGIPGFGLDQEYVHFIRNVLPKTSPKIVIWSVHENDWEGHDFGCLVPQTGTLSILSAYRNTLFWQAVLSPLLPSVITESKTYNFLRSAVPENFTFGCSSREPISIEEQNKKKKKIFSAMKTMAAREGFTLHIVYVQSQHAYSKTPPEGYEEETKRKLRVFDGIIDKPVIVSEKIKGLIENEISAEMKLLSEPDQELFVLEDPSGYGGQHMNEEGNRMFASVLNALIKEK
jgi:hypothetical protein